MPSETDIGEDHEREARQDAKPDVLEDDAQALEAQAALDEDATADQALFKSTRNEGAVA